jgi:hypothetical protein
MPVVGYLSTQGASGERLRMFLRGFSEAGLSEGNTHRISLVEGQFDRLARLAADLVGRRVRMIVPTM